MGIEEFEPAKLAIKILRSIHKSVGGLRSIVSQSPSGYIRLFSTVSNRLERIGWKKTAVIDGIETIYTPACITPVSSTAFIMDVFRGAKALELVTRLNGRYNFVPSNFYHHCLFSQLEEIEELAEELEDEDD